MQTSKLSGKCQLTLPKKVREILRAVPGDTIGYDVEGNIVRLRRMEAFDAAFHKALSNTLSEWSSREDEAAFDAL